MAGSSPSVSRLLRCRLLEQKHPSWLICFNPPTKRINDVAVLAIEKRSAAEYDLPPRKQTDGPHQGVTQPKHRGPAL